MCFTLRLHMSAAPTQGGLTQALGGRTAFGGFAFQCFFPRLRLALLSGQIVGRCFFGQVRLARSHITCVTLAGFGNSDWCDQLSRY
jgi:hypothetical protein